VAREADCTVAAVLRQRVALDEPESPLLLRGHELQHVHLLDVAEQVPGLDEVVARVEVPVVLERHRAAARLGEDAHRRRCPQPRRQRRIEHLHVDSADVTLNPFVEDVDQEPAPLFGANRAAGHVVAFEDVERTRVAAALAPSLVRHREQLLGDALDDGDELDEGGLQLVAKEPVDLDRVAGVRRMNRAHHVDIHAVVVQRLIPTHHIVERSLAALVDAIRIVKLARAVDAQADQDVVPLQEGAPRVVQPGAVGLERVRNLLSRLLVALHAGDRALEELEPHQRRLAALPADDHVGARVRLEQLADVGVEQIVGHAEPAARIEHFLREEEAVLTIEIADRAGRFGEHVKIGARHGGQLDLRHVPVLGQGPSQRAAMRERWKNRPRNPDDDGRL